MTDEEKMKAVVQAAGECWHEWKIKYILQDYTTRKATCIHCKKESGWVKGEVTENPSPTDLNELFRLAEKLNVNVRVVQREGFSQKWAETLDTAGGIASSAYANTPAEALLDALYQAVKERQS